jgi:hypothetical protein
MSIESNNDPAQNRFDEAIRAQHAASLEHLSSRTRAQLQWRKRAALAGKRAQSPASPWRFAWPLAAACAVGGLAIGLQVRTTQAPTPQIAAAPVVDDSAAAYTTLEENPDLYVWLASDGATLAME